jgi:VanZ family protein
MTLRQLLHWFRQIDAWLVVPAVLLVIWGELTHSRIAAEVEVDVWDKAVHFTAYAGLALMTTIAVRARPVVAMWLAFGLIVMGGLLEIVQGMTGRDADIWDEAANTLGVLAGAGIAWAGIAFLRARKLVEDGNAD